MALQLRRGHTSSFGKMIAASFAVLALVLQPLVLSNVPSAFAAELDPFPSTNQQNRTNGNPYVELVSSNYNTVVLKYVNPRPQTVWFEYRVDTAAPGTGQYGPCRIGNISLPAACNGKRYLAADDYSFASVSVAGSSSVTRTYTNVQNQVSVRSTFGPERNWDFDWVSFTTSHGVCEYDFPAQKMWEINWGRQLADRNAVQLFDMQSHGGLISLNDGPVPSYMTSSWHWIYPVEGQARFFKYGFADGTVRTANVTFSDVNGCQVPQIAWNLLPFGKPTLLSPANNGYTITNNFYFDWTDVDGAVSYEFQNSKVNTATNGVLTTINYSATNIPGSTLYSSGAADGSVRYWQVRAVSANGTKGAWSDIWKMTIDMTPPATPTLESPSNNALINYNSFWFEWNDVSGAVSYEFRASQSSSTDGSGALNTGVWHGDASGNQPTESRAWSSGANGTWYWQVRAVDAAGNKSAWTTPWKLTIDMTAPTATITSPADGGSVNGVVAVTGTVADANPMNSYFSIYNASGSVVATSFYGDGRTTHSFNWNTASLPEGQYIIYFEARDKLGNKQGTIASPGASVKKITVTIDRTAPEVSLSAIAPVTEGQNSVISGSISDASATEVEVFIDGISRGTVGVSGGTFTFEYALTAGEYPVYVIARDAAGNPATSGTQVAKVTTAPSENNGGNEENPSGPTTPTGPTAPAEPEDEEETTDDEDEDIEQLQIFTEPIVVVNNPAVLGDQDINGSNQLSGNSGDESDQDVMGTTDEKKDGTFSPLGFAWYWWLAVLAGIAALLWLLAARRRRNAEEDA